MKTRLAALATLLIVAISAVAMPPVPRKSPEFSIVEPSGKEILLSSFKGKVVVIGFVHTTCIHCQVFSQMLTKLQKELGARGFQPVDVAWNDGAAMRVPIFVKEFNLSFPVGYSQWDPIMSFMGFSVMDRPVVPQIAVIDRKGMIRAQTPPQGNPDLQDESKLRTLIETLLKEK